MASGSAPGAQTVKVPKLEPVPFVVVKLSDGTTALRHPSELKKQ